ncbi:FkbM family methyltransferase [uncultured Cytophaga sp.]|uniref:FkbM family methyltransferase n=1 Tax=uncultured Cytophaga sp. TaxID=160238 RepID=UPI00260D800D|nr:FkbM family methyltransferase [uncultured Cytophaga sp.]
MMLGVYGFVPLKCELFSMIRFFYLPKESIFRHLYFKGNFKVSVDKEHSFLMKHYGSGFAMESDHFWKGVGACERYSIDLWIKYAKQSDLILDIGANTGTYSLIASALNSNAEVHAFEPVKRTFDKLQSNVQINTFDIHLHNIALSDTVGEIFLMEEGGSNEYTAHVTKLQNPNSYLVCCKRLDSILNVNYIGKNILMKLDVERHEVSVLLGMGDLLKQLRPIILLEVLDEEMAIQLNPFFENLEYVFYNIDEMKGYFEISSVQKSFGNNIFCCPKEKVLQS